MSAREDYRRAAALLHDITEVGETFRLPKEEHERELAKRRLKEQEAWQNLDKVLRELE
jgi:hypothetical protein